MLHTAHHTLQNRWHKARINSSSNNRVDEDELAAPLQRNLFLAFHGNADFLIAKLVERWVGHTVAIGFHYEVYLTKLTSSAALLLMAIVGACSLRDGFTIGDALLVKLNWNLVKIFQTPFQRTEVEFALSVNQNLAQFLRLFNHPCRVFLTHTV